jgi:acyl-coenzyme A thioesterase PaaI-like protein
MVSSDVGVFAFGVADPVGSLSAIGVHESSNFGVVPTRIFPSRAHVKSLSSQSEVGSRDEEPFKLARGGCRPSPARDRRRAVDRSALAFRVHVDSGDHMTDISNSGLSVPSRLGTTARHEDGNLIIELTPQPETLHHGVVRASVLAFVIDVAAGIPMDQDPGMWTFTSDMSVRMRPVPAPTRIDASYTILRQGGRSSTCLVELSSDDGSPIATGAIGFAKVPRKATDPAKPNVPSGEIPLVFRTSATLDRPLRDAAGIEVLDPSEGVVQVEVTPDLRNPAGTLQGAMVALLAEAAAEDLIATRFDVPVVVTDLDLRYLRKAEIGPIRTRTRILGTGPEAPIQVELIDTTSAQITTLVFARVATIF